MRWVAAVAFGFYLAGHYAGADQKAGDELEAKTVVADKFEVPGPKGTPAAMLYRSEDGQPRLVFLGEKGELRLSVGLNPDGSAGIYLLGADHKARFYMGFAPKKTTPQLSLYDDQGNEMISLEVANGAGPTIWVGTKDKGRISMGLSKEGEPAVVLWSANNEPRLGIDFVDGAPTMRFMDSANVVRARWKLRPDGSPDFSLLDAKSRERLSIGTDPAGHPFIHWIDPDTKAAKTIR